jgi:hypothetical protein
LIGRIIGEGVVEIRKAPDDDVVDRPADFAIAGLAGGEAALECALIAHHEQNILLPGDLGKPFAKRIPLPEM